VMFVSYNEASEVLQPPDEPLYSPASSDASENTAVLGG